jgi:hypothetical protein
MSKDKLTFNQIMFIIFVFLLFTSVQGQVTGSSLLSNFIPNDELRFAVFSVLGIGSVFFYFKS